ncbi:MAG TPA: hypothetical protein PLY93_06420 [Turneriella sp.]|nr:hypothetical protein [Turneriella sp.]
MKNIFSYALLFLFLHCRSTSTTHYNEEENHRTFSIDAAEKSYKVSLFSKTYSALLSPSFSLVLVSPVLVDDSLLYKGNTPTVIPWFNARGVSVWLVHVPPQTPLKKFGATVMPQITKAIRKNSTEKKWVMGGVSLGGQAMAHYLVDAKKHAQESGMDVSAAFFLASPFDYAYPSSFGRRLSSKSIDIKNMRTRFLPQIPADLVTELHNLFDGANPVWSETVDPIDATKNHLRLFFTAGKIDNVAPTESVYKFYTQTIGGNTKNSPDIRLLIPGRMNNYKEDYDHAMMITSEALVDEVLPEILRWINL